MMIAPYDVLTYEVKTFFENLQSCRSNYNAGNIDSFNMTHKKTDKRQTITIYKNCITQQGIYRTKLGNIPNFNKIINVNNIECDCKLTYDHVTDKYYMYMPQYVKTNPIDNRKKICAIDPGEHTPFVYYSLDDYGFIGDEIRKKILAKETNIRQYQRLINKGITKKCKKVNKAKIIKQINREYRKIKGIVNELHKKSALYFCQNYNIILIPKFETKSMISDKESMKRNVKKRYDDIKEKNKDNIQKLRNELKSYKRHRRLNSRVKFVLNQLSHYKFKQHLFSKAKEYGCLCLEVTEEFTSQLCTVCGNCDKFFKQRQKVCSHCNSEINRDVNGSRNILLKNIDKYLHK